MTVLTVNDFAQQMVAQARVLNPSFSGEVGTPERLMIDAVAQSLADNQVDLTGLQGALDIDSKFGTNLDRFAALFGFQRQQAAAATGYVVFSRISAAPVAITIPQGTTLQANTTLGISGTIQYTTTAGGTISAGATVSSAVPVQAIVTGTVGNVPANAITILVGTLPSGVTSVTNPNALVNGVDPEDDNSFKVRFKNTWARNLAGVSAQYLALAIAGPFTTKANVIGIQSRYQEYIQIPSFDDAGYLNGAQTVTQNTGNGGIQGRWTTALSTIPYAKQIYTNTQVFVSNGQAGGAEYFYRPDTDFQFNYPPRTTGDVIRTTQTTASSGQNFSAGNTLQVTSVVVLPTSGTLVVNNQNTGAPQLITYTGLSASPVGVTNCQGGPFPCLVNTNDPIYLVPTVTSVTPNFTLLNVYNPSSPVTIPGLQATAPEAVLLTEFSYVSSASRNDLQHNVSNAVDVYVNGSNNIASTDVFLLPLSFTNLTFNTNSNSPWYYENFRRDGQRSKRPQINNFITPLFQTPLGGLPATLTIAGQNFYEGTHYWLVHETDSLGGSIRARDGIEWNADLQGDLGGFPIPANPHAPYYPTGGNFINTFPLNTVLEIDGYLYDANIPVLQASIEASRQITTDVLAHKAYMRYFKLDIAVIYTAHANLAGVNAAIEATVQAYFDRQYFGAIITLSTLLEVIHEVPGVENVRWTNDLPVIPTLAITSGNKFGRFGLRRSASVSTVLPELTRVIETDVNGNPLHGASIDRLQTNPATVEQQTLYIVGIPAGTFILSWTDTVNIPGSHTMTTAAINFTDATGTPVTAATIQGNIQTAASNAGVASGIYNAITVTKDTRPTTNVSEPITSFTITYGAVGIPYLPSITQTITSSQYAYDSDFILLDDQLPTLPQNALATDTVPGLIIRQRSQNTFYRTIPVGS